MSTALLWVRVAFDVAQLIVVVVVRMRARPPSAFGVLALALPTFGLVSLFVLAGLSSPHAHRASQAGVAVADAGCLAAAAVAWTGASFARRLQSKYKFPLLIYGVGVGVFFVGEAIAVTVLNL